MSDFGACFLEPGNNCIICVFLQVQVAASEAHSPVDRHCLEVVPRITYPELHVYTKRSSKFLPFGYKIAPLAGAGWTGHSIPKKKNR